MIKTTIGHLVFNVYPQNLSFYKDLFAFAGWQTLFEEPGFLGIGCESGASVWFGTSPNDNKNDYDGVGMNHFALAVIEQGDVDKMVAYLKEHNVQALFGTPCHRPEFCSSPDQTYYQVMFESPDRILFEVVYTGPKQS